MTTGRIFNLTLTSQILALLDKYPPPAAQSLASTLHMSDPPGGVAIHAHCEIVAVGGSPGGDKDEECA